MNNQIRKKIVTITLSPPLSILLIIWLVILIAALNPFSAAASALEDTSAGIYVHGLPTPVITGIDANNSIVLVKADGYINEDSSLLVTVALVNENGDVVDVSEKKVSDPENIRVSLHVDKIKVGDNIFAKFTNHGIDGDGADLTHETQESTEEPGTTAPPTIIIDRGKGSSSVTYIVTEAEPEQIVIEKLVESEPEIIEKINNNFSSPAPQAVSPISGESKSGNSDNKTLLPNPTSPQIAAEEVSPIETLIKDGKLSAKGEIILFSFLIFLIIVTSILICVMLRNHFKNRKNDDNNNCPPTPQPNPIQSKFKRLLNRMVILYILAFTLCLAQFTVLSSKVTQIDSLYSPDTQLINSEKVSTNNYIQTDSSVVSNNKKNVAIAVYIGIILCLLALVVLFLIPNKEYEADYKTNKFKEV